jgi:hypothetical protein
LTLLLPEPIKEGCTTCRLLTFAFGDNSTATSAAASWTRLKDHGPFFFAKLWLECHGLLVGSGLCRISYTEQFKELSLGSTASAYKWSQLLGNLLSGYTLFCNRSLSSSLLRFRSVF